MKTINETRMSILELKKNAIIVVNAILSMFLIRAILFFVKIEFGKIVLLDHIADVKVLISIIRIIDFFSIFCCSCKDKEFIVFFLGGCVLEHELIINTLIIKNNLNIYKV